MSQKLSGKVAVVTGASKGIGASIAPAPGGGRGSGGGELCLEQIRRGKIVGEITTKGGKAIAVQADMAKDANIRWLFAETKKAFDRVDILVNNAGVYEFAPLENITAEHFHKLFNLNVLGLILATQEAVKHMGSAGGAIVNISSIVARSAPPGGSVYSATKAAVDAVTRSLSQELGPRKIRVNSINPGMVVTEGVKAAGINESEMGKKYETQAPLGRLGQPQDIATAAVFLASPDSGLDDWRNAVHCRRISLRSTPLTKLDSPRWFSIDSNSATLPELHSWLEWRRGTRNPISAELFDPSNSHPGQAHAKVSQRR